MTECRVVAVCAGELGEGALWSILDNRPGWASAHHAALQSFGSAAGHRHTYRPPYKTLGSFGFTADGDIALEADCCTADRFDPRTEHIEFPGHLLMADVGVRGVPEPVFGASRK